MNEQFELPMEPKVTHEELSKYLPEQIKHLASGVECAIDASDKDMPVVTLSGSGVTSTFSIDLYKLSAKLNEDKSYDLLAGASDHTETDGRPLQNADDIHEERKSQLLSALQEIADPSLIED